VTVSTAAGFCSKLVVNWKTTYSPPGAPGSVVVDVALFGVRDFIAPSGARGLYSGLPFLRSDRVF
jgi:hypothetical protein